MTDSFDEKIVELLKGGAVGFMPSDTIYSLSCSALNKVAVKRVHKIKDRDLHKPFVILISNLKMLDLLSISESEVEPVKKYWPGPLTIICNAPKAPEWLRLSGQTLAIRIPADKKLRDLIEAAGPIISTSANIQGEEPANSVNEAKKYFGDDLDFYVNKGDIASEPSTIAVYKSGKLIIDRPGAVKIKETK